MFGRFGPVTILALLLLSLTPPRLWAQGTTLPGPDQAAQSLTPTWGTNPQQVLEAAAQSGKPVYVYIWARYDRACEATAAETLLYDQVVAQLQNFERLAIDAMNRRNFPFLGPESFLAAEAAEAAAALGRYWEYKTLLFTRFQREGRAAYRPERLKAYAAELGLDQRVFGEALDRGAFRASVLAERREGEALGVGATPSFVMNGRLLDGIPTVERFGKLIEEELARKR